MKTAELLAEELSTLNWPAASLILMAHFISGVIKLRTVNLIKLAGIFAESNYTAPRYNLNFSLKFQSTE